VFLLIQTFVAQPYQVQQVSMLPTFNPSDYVLVDKLTPHFSAYERGQVVVFQPNIRDDCGADVVHDEGSEPFIKRVIGVAGDTLELRDGAVWLNGAPLDEPYVHGEQSTPESDLDSWVVPDGALFLMGDNRESSSDSRSFGPICTRDVIGRAWVRYWPLSKFGLVATER
jgi:signal peptidase I